MLGVLICTTLAAFLCWKLLDRLSHGKIPLQNKAILVTGCDSGFGNFLARRLDRIGCVVFACCLDSESNGAKQLQAECSSRMRVMTMDVCSDQSVADTEQEVSDYITNAKSDLWGVVNNAGIIVKGEIELCSMATFHKVIDTNLYGTIRVTKAFLPLIRKAKGRVINMSSAHGRHPTCRCSCYGISKYGIENFSDVLRMEMEKFKVKVSIIEPGSYGSATDIQTEKSISNRLQVLHKDWLASTSEVQEAYKDSYEALRKLLTSSVRKSSQSAEPVIQAFLDALGNIRPRERYLVGGQSSLIDPHYFLVRVNPFLPTSWMDKLIMYILK